MTMTQTTYTRDGDYYTWEDGTKTKVGDRVQRPPAPDRGKYVPLDAGYRLFENGDMIGPQGNGTRPENDIERLRRTELLHKTLVAALSAELKALRTATAPTDGTEVGYRAGWTWPEFNAPEIGQPGSWIRQWVGNPILDSNGRPDAKAAVAHFENLIAHHRKQYETAVKALHTDDGGKPLLLDGPRF